MKLATYHDGSRDGQLLVVARDLSLAHHAFGIAGRLQDVLDDWNFLSPQLEELSQTLNHGKARHAFAFDPRRCMAPLPRAYQRLGTVAPAGEAAAPDAPAASPPAREPPPGPRVYQGSSDDSLGPHDAWTGLSRATGLDCAATLAVVTGDVPRGTGSDAALEHVRLLMLANDLILPGLARAERAAGLGFVLSRPCTAYSAVAVTPDELGPAWHGGRVHLDLDLQRNGGRIDLCNAASAMEFHFGELISHVCTTRALRAGSIVGGSAIATRGRQHKQDAGEAAADSGADVTAPLQDGDIVRFEIRDAAGLSVFGAIEQRVDIGA